MLLLGHIHVSYFRAAGTPVFGFLMMSPLGGFCLIHIFAEVSVMYIPWDPLLVLHLSTSWWPAVQSATSPHTVAEVRLGSDLIWQSPGQKTNALPLCQRPGFAQENYIYSEFVVSFENFFLSRKLQSLHTIQLKNFLRNSRYYGAHFISIIADNTCYSSRLNYFS